ncbi:MAG: hypothetical protein ATN36_00165 [Epulopiscium sp. Nele67-Bin005]|nr:MAG: hypothetical protein ATN36_00165 [Epulopiscium sp. Nele67-Bin005]
MKRVHPLRYETVIYQRWVYALTLIVAITAGCMYGIDMGENDILLFTVNQYLTVNVQRTPVLEAFRTSLMTYGLSIIIVFVGGLSKMLLPLSILGVFYTVFSYSFTMTCFLLIYGLTGIWVSILMIGVQAALLVSILIEVGYQGLRYSVYSQIKNIKFYYSVFVKALVVAIVISTFDAIFHPMLHNLVISILQK